MLRLADSWVWDFWLADSGDAFHVFFLRASRALRDPDRRHHRASVGHAVSTDLRQWELLPDALVASDGPAWDDLATWTGSVVQGDDGVWRMFYTGLRRSEGGHVQRIGAATSSDLVTWTAPAQPLVESDSRWYETVPGERDRNVHWRDPWVFADPDGHGWHMLITARSAFGPADSAGVVGHAWSPDLESWEVREPLSSPGAGFGQLEVPQVAVVEGRPVLLFSCLSTEFELSRRTENLSGGSWTVAAPSLLGPFDIASATPLCDPRFYSARLVQDRAGRWQALAFHNLAPDGQFDGALSDPMPVRWLTPGVLGLETAPNGGADRPSPAARAGT